MVDCNLAIKARQADLSYAVDPLALPSNCIDSETGKQYSDKYSDLYRDLVVTLEQGGIESPLRLTKRALDEGKLGFYSGKAYVPGQSATIRADR